MEHTLCYQESRVIELTGYMINSNGEFSDEEHKESKLGRTQL